MFTSTKSRSRHRDSNQAVDRRSALRASVAPAVEALELRRLLSAATTPAADAPNPGGAPNAPYVLSAQPDTGHTGVAFSFYDSADNEQGFVIERATSANGPFTQIAQLPPSAGRNAQVTYDDTTATAGGTYFYTAIAINGPYASSTPPAASATATPTPTPTSTPYGGTPWTLSGQIEAENFDNGGEGVAYHDTDAPNLGGAYRPGEGVDLQPTGDATGGGYNVGWTHAGEWLAYTVNVASAGTYDFDARVANIGSGASFHVEVDGVDVTGTMAVPDTGDWAKYGDVTKGGIALTAGQHVVKLVMDTDASSGYAGNYNWFKFTASPTPTPTPTGVPTVDTSYGTGGDFQDVSAGPATRVVVSPDGSQTYALTTAAPKGNNPIHLSGPVVDWTTGSGTPYWVDVNQFVPVPMDRATGLAVQADGKFLVAGNAGGDIVVARFNPDGSLDTSFGNSRGEFIVDYAGNEQVADVAVAANGQIYVGGTHDVYGANADEYFAIRLNADGSLDHSFGYNGISKGDVQNRAGQFGGGVGATSIAVDNADGSVIVVGDRMGSFDDILAGIEVARLLPNGNATTLYSVHGNRPGRASAEDVIVQADRKIVVVGTTGDSAFSERFNADGTIDPTWVGPGDILAYPNGNSELDGVAQLVDGSYVVVGQETPTGGNRVAIVAHLKAADGTVAGGSAGVVTHPLPDVAGSSDTAYDAVAAAPDDSVFAAGESHGWALISKYRIA